MKVKCHFARQAKYLVRLEGDTCCSAHCKWRFICNEECYFVVLCSTGVVLCSTGVVLCSTE